MRSVDRRWPGPCRERLSTLADSGRYFFALWPEVETLGLLQRFADSLPTDDGHLLHGDDLHITLAFLGQLSEVQRGCLLAAADQISFAPFELQLDRLDLWRRPGILWCGPSTTPPELQRLVGQLQQGLEQCGLALEKRPYTPHVTLARKARRLPDLLIPEPICWPVRGFVLATSADGQGPRRYQVIKKWLADS